jgi:hypothetical protein
VQGTSREATCELHPQSGAAVRGAVALAADRAGIDARATMAPHGTGANAVPPPRWREARAAAGMTAETCTIAELGFTE